MVPINKKQNHKANKAAKNRIQKLEKLIDAHTQKLVDVTARLGDSDIYEPENQHELQRCMEDSQRLKSELDDYEAEWMELSESLED